MVTNHGVEESEDRPNEMYTEAMSVLGEWTRGLYLQETHHDNMLSTFLRLMGAANSALSDARDATL